MARRKQPPRPKPRAVAAAAFGMLAANPTAVAGSVVMTAMAVAIMTNALTMQPGRHPAPLFHGVRPPVGVAPASAPEQPRSHVAAYDRSLVAAIQTELAARGYYEGEVDGLAGPKTSAAIAAFQRDSGMVATGEAASDVLAVLKRSRQAPVRRSDVPVPMPAPAAPPTETAALEGFPPLPRPRPTVPAPDADIETAAIPGQPAAPIIAGPAAPGTDPLGDLIAGPPKPRPADAPPASPPPPAADGRPLAEEAMVVVPTVAAVETVRVQPEARPLTLNEPPPDPRLARIQDALDRLGYGPLRADGLMSASTRDAIRRFEANRSLPVTGEINEGFLVELMKIGGLATP